MGSFLKLHTILRCLLLTEAILYASLGFVLSERGNGYGAIAVIVLSIALVWRLSHALGTFVLAAGLRWRDGRTLPWGSSLAALTDEFAARFVCFNWSQAFPGVAVRPDPSGARDGPPILLVHGYLCNRGVWTSLSRRLAEAGLGPIYTITFDPMFGSVDRLVSKLDTRIEAICHETGAAKIMVVAHSMGGLVARAYRVQTPGQSRIERMVTLGTPHHGTQVARWGIGINARQMRERCEWIKTLAAREAMKWPNENPPETLSIYTLNDDVVYPPESCALDWAGNMPVSAVGHMGLVFSESVAKRVIQHLR